MAERKYSMLMNDVGSRHAGSDRVQVSSLPGDIHAREVVGRSLAHSAAPSPVSSVFEPIQRPQAVMNYNFGERPFRRYNTSCKLCGHYLLLLLL